MNFKVGDIVKLRTGGPDMTVQVIVPDLPLGPMVSCAWFDDRKQLQQGMFAPATLESV
jgi:uncharacterized protein YodC (DUF2158 family)